MRLTDTQRQLITGSLLGDGCLFLGQKAKNPYFKICRSLKDKKYLEWQYSILQNLCNSNIRECSYFDNRTQKIYNSCRLITKSLPELLSFYHDWYPDRIKIIPKIELSPLILAVWFADDGYIRKLNKSELRLSLATDGFSLSDIEYLANELTIFLKAKFRITKKASNQYTIDASSDGTYSYIRNIFPIFDQLQMNRKIVWSDINLNFPAQTKRSKKYYQLAEFLNNKILISPKDIFLAKIYSITQASEVLCNFYKSGYFTRYYDNNSYHYVLTDLGIQYFHSLRQETQQQFNHRIEE